MTAKRPLRLLLAVALVTVPLWAPALDATGTDYRYRSTPVVVEGDEVRIVDGSDLPVRGVEGIDCLYDLGSEPRACVHDAGLLNGTRRADHPGVRRVGGNPFAGLDERYVAFENPGPVYARTLSWSNDSFELGLRRANASEAVEDVAADVEKVPAPVARAARSGAARSDDEVLDRGVVVETGDGYRLVYEAGTDRFAPVDPGTERGLEWIAVLFGAALLWRDR